MFRSKTILPVALLFLSISAVSQTREVKVKMDVPGSVTAGTSFPVKIFFSKGNLQSFSRLFQDLPAGLQAVSVNPANADFSFQDKRVRMIWFRLPETDTFSVVYSVQVDYRLKGKFTLGGSFSYVDNGERKSIQLPAKEITILPSPSTDSRLLVDINDFEKKVPSAVTAVSGPEVFCLRNMEPSNNLPGEEIITLLIYKGNLTSFGKLEDTIPAGYTAVAVERKDGLFTLRDGMVRFLWMNLPADPWFTISYRLTPKSGAPGGTIQLKGAFSYTSQNRTFSVPVSPTGQPLARLDKPALSTLVDAMVSGKGEMPLLASEETKPAGQAALPPTTSGAGKEEKKPSVQQPAVPTVTAVRSEEKKASAEKTPSSVEKLPSVAAEKKNKPAVTPSESGLPETAHELYRLLPEKGVYFRVQIAATRNKISVPQHFRRLKITDEVRMEEAEGWYKYTVGSFHTYEEAKKYKEELFTKTLLKDAFIIAYNNGKRISVQEALALTHSSTR